MSKTSGKILEAFMRSNAPFTRQEVTVLLGNLERENERLRAEHDKQERIAYRLGDELAQEKLNSMRLRAELAEAREDAERYRWLRSATMASFPPTELGEDWWGDVLGEAIDEDFDAAIDEALARHKEQP